MIKSLFSEIESLDFEVPRPPLSCKVVIGKDIFRNITSVINLRNYSQSVIITEPGINDLFGELLINSLKKIDKTVTLLEIKGGESNKTENAADKILKELLRLTPTIDRNSLIMALGGGVVGDITGYVAGRILRGLDYLQIPTTLLAMVDSSLGGKTAVDFDGLTNMIGLFHLPKIVVMDVTVLKTLPEEQWQSGFAELLKHGFLEPKLFSLLVKLDDSVLKKDKEILIEALKLSAQFKMKIVNKDYEEKTGARKVLNFGHTVGRALETATGLSRFTHGEAVAIGMATSILISLKQGLLPKKIAQTMLNIIKKFKLPIKTEGIGLKLLWQAMRRDKKAVGGIPQFVLLEGIGKPKVNYQVDEKIIDKVFKEVFL